MGDRSSLLPLWRGQLAACGEEIDRQIRAVPSYSPLIVSPVSLE
jgi:hypothetical protein